MKEIKKQEEELGISFQTIVCAVGSGSTYGGLFLGTKLYDPEKTVLGFNVCDDEQYFLDVCTRICRETVELLGKNIEIKPEDMHIVDGHKGIGYAISTDEELAFLIKLAREEGLILDPVYTGKAFYGLYQEIKEGKLKDLGNVLFIHTGGVFGLFPKQEQLAKVLEA